MRRLLKSTFATQPQFYSHFGGLGIDRKDADQQQESKRTNGTVMASMANRSVTEGWRAAILLLLLPSLTYLALITDFRFDPFEPHGYWKAYNAYFQSLTEGRLDVPPDVINVEGQYWNGKAYMYYGALPALLRLPFAPFVDLNTTPVARATVWLMAAVGASVMQWTLLLAYRRSRTAVAYPGRTAILFLLFSALLWFGSGHFIAVQNASMYHEPFVAALLLCTLFSALFVHDFLLDETRPPRFRLVLYATLAALCVHARPTMAISLYLASGVLILTAIWHDVRSIRTSPLGIPWRAVAAASLHRATMPVLLLGLSGALLLLMNNARFGSAFSMGSFEHYGQFLVKEGYSSRICAFIEHGRYNAYRILPNLLYCLFGARDWYQHLYTQFNLGWGRIEEPTVPLIVLWSLPLLAMLIFIGQLIVRVSRPTLPTVLAGLLFLALIFGAMLQLSYGTVTYRYSIEFWPALSLSMLAVWPLAVRALDRASANAAYLGLAFGSVLTITTLVFGFYHYTSYRFFALYGGNLTRDFGTQVAPLKLEGVSSRQICQGFNKLDRIGRDRLRDRVNSSIFALRASLNGIKDETTAQAAVPAFTQTASQLDELIGLVGQLTPEARKAMVDAVAPIRPGLGELFDRILRLPGVSVVLKSTINGVRSKFDTLTQHKAAGTSLGTQTAG